MTDDMDETARAEFLLMKLLRTRWDSFSSVFLRYALALSFLSAVADRFGLWGSFGQPNVAWGSFSRFLEYTRRLNWYLPAGIDPAAGGYHDGRGVALRSSSSCRLAHTSHRVTERTSADVVRAGNDPRIRSRGAPECFRFPAAGGALLLAHSERFPFSVDNLPFRRRHTGQETAGSGYQRRSPERRINFKEMR